jgi:hypothetical protein
MQRRQFWSINKRGITRYGNINYVVTGRYITLLQDKLCSSKYIIRFSKIHGEQLRQPFYHQFLR